MSRICARPCSTLLACLLVAGAAIAAGATPAGETVGSVRAVRGFDRVSLEIGGKLILTQADAESLEIEASAADLSRIATAVRLGTLHIGQARPNESPRGPVTYRLAMRKIAGLETHSSGSIEATSIDADDLRVTIQSSGGITVESLRARSLEVVISSSGDCTLSGAVEQQVVRISSSGEYRADDLASRRVRIDVTSSGTATLRVAESLDVRISSSGNVRYRGDPPRVTSRLSSSGRLIKLAD